MNVTFSFVTSEFQLHRYYCCCATVHGWVVAVQVAKQDILAGVVNFAVIVCKVVTVTAQPDIVKLAVQTTDGALVVYWVIAFLHCNLKAVEKLETTF